MVNNVIITGHFKGFNKNNKLLLEMDALETHQIVKIDIVDGLKNKIEEFIRKNDIVGIKGYIKLDDAHNIIIVATKITFLSSKQKAQN